MTAAASNNYADILSKVNLFAGLERVDLARLAGYVESQSFTQGITVCREGDKLNGVYVVAQGQLGIFIATPDGLGEVRRTSLTPGDVLGDMALIDDAAAAPTVRAESDGELLRLDAARVIEFLHLQPATLKSVKVILKRGQTLNGSELVRSAGKTGRGNVAQQRMARALVLVELGRLPPERLNRVLQASVLQEPSLPALRLLFDEAADEVARDLTDLGIRRDRDSEPVLQALRERFEQVQGKDVAVQFVQDCVAMLIGAQLWNDALAVLNRIGDRKLLVQTLGQALSGTPPLTSERAKQWLDSLSDDETLADGRMLLARAAKLESQGDREAAARLLRKGLGIGLAGADPNVGQQIASELSRLGTAMTQPHGAAKQKSNKRGDHIAIGVSAILTIIAILLDPSNTPARFLLLLPAGLLLWITGILPEFAVGLILVLSWILFGIASPSQALAGFASSNWFFVVSILGLASAISSSGLLYRVGLLLVRRMPQGLFWQALIVLLTGIVLTPLLPQPQGRVAITGPIALSLAETLRLRDRESAASVLGMAAWVGASPLQFMFLNGGPVILFGWGLLPPETRLHFDWIHWTVATAPLAIAIGLGVLASLFLIFRPTVTSAPSQERLQLQLAVLGPISRREIMMTVILVLTVMGWVFLPAHGIDVGTIAVAGFIATVIAGLFTRRAIQSLDWNYLVFFGVMLGIRGVMRSLGLDHLISDTIGQALAPIRGQVILIILLVACSSLLVRLVLAQTSTLLTLGLALMPLAPLLDVHPWLILIALLATSGMWFLPTQSASYLVAFSVTEGRLYSHGQARWIAFSYAIITLLALALAVPYWRWLGIR